MTVQSCSCSRNTQGMLRSTSKGPHPSACRGQQLKVPRTVLIRPGALSLRPVVQDIAQVNAGVPEASLSRLEQRTPSTTPVSDTVVPSTLVPAGQHSTGPTSWTPKNVKQRLIKAARSKQLLPLLGAALLLGTACAAGRKACVLATLQGRT